MSNKVATTKAGFIRLFKESLADKEIFLTSAMAKDAYEIFVDIVEKTLAAGERVSLNGIGALKISERPARKGRNPRTGEEISIPAKRNVVFRPTASLKGKINK